MAIIWIGGILSVLLAFSAGMLYRDDPVSQVNYSTNVATALVDNLQTVTMAAVKYGDTTISAKLTPNESVQKFNIARGQVSSNGLFGYLPSGFSSLVDYVVTFGIDDKRHRWLIVSYAHDIGTAPRGINEVDYRQVLTILTQRVNNKVLNGQGLYRQVYAGINNNCELSSTVVDIDQINNANYKPFNQICRKSSIGKYVIMIAIQ